MRWTTLVSAGLLAGVVLGGTPAIAFAESSPGWTPARISDDPAVKDNPTDATATNEALIKAGKLTAPKLVASNSKPGDFTVDSQAATPAWALSCPVGSWCVWTEINGTGYRAAPAGNVSTFTSTFRNNDWSAYNNGTSGASVAVYDLPSYVGNLYVQGQYYAWGFLNPGGQGESMRWI
jgi:Peptidase inhibitor family I36